MIGRYVTVSLSLSRMDEWNQTQVQTARLPRSWEEEDNAFKAKPHS